MEPGMLVFLDEPHLANAMGLMYNRQEQGYFILYFLMLILSGCTAVLRGWLCRTQKVCQGPQIWILTMTAILIVTMFFSCVRPYWNGKFNNHVLELK